MRELRQSRRELPDWEDNSKKARELLEYNCFQESVDHYIEAIEYVPDFYFNMLYDRIVDSYSNYILDRSDGKIPIDVAPLERLAIEINRFTLHTHELHLSIVENILKKMGEYESIDRKINLFNISNSLSKQFFGITTSLGSYFDICGHMVEMCDSLSQVSCERQSAVDAYHVLYQAIHSKSDVLTEETEKALEYAYEWLFSEKDRTYVRYINELYEITYDFIREKRLDLSRLKEDLNVILDQFELEYRSILGYNQ